MVGKAGILPVLVRRATAKTDSAVHQMVDTIYRQVSLPKGGLFGPITVLYTNTHGRLNELQHQGSETI